MKIQKELSEKLELLVAELTASKNSTTAYYEKVLEKLNQTSDLHVLKSIALGILSSSKIKDLGGYSNKEILLWDSMWKTAEKLSNNLDRNI